MELPGVQWARRRWRWPAAGLALLAAAGAFLLWGPIGFGNGPLSLGSGATSNRVPGRALLAIFMPVSNSGHGAVTIDSIRLAGAAGYPVPRVMTLHLTGTALCGGTWTLLAARPRLQIAGGCRARDLGPLTGHPIGHTASYSQLSAVAVVRSPDPGRCWAVSAVVVRYHVGIRHWTATEPDEYAACAGTSQAVLNRALAQAERAAPQ